MSKKLMTTSILLLVFMGGFFILYNPKTVSNPTQNNSDASKVLQKWEPKIDEQALVTVTVTPIDILPQSKEWRFDTIISTHSVELEQDMAKIAVLIDNQNKEYHPIRWEGAEQGGHHREGVLIFNQITPTPKSVELKIFEIGGVVRSFKWQF